MKSLKALATELGVSTAAVSYVYHGKWKEKRLSEALAKRIQEALDKEGVRPSLAGIQLKTGRSMAIGVLLPDFENPHWMEILKGVESVLTPAGLLMLLTTTRLGEAEADALASISARGVDGVIMSPHNDAASFAATLAGLGRETPMVFVDTFLKDSKFDYISTDNRKGAFALVSGLVSSGRRKIAYLGSAKPLSALAERFEGYADALKAAGIALDESLIGRTLSGFEGVEARLSALLDSANPPDALFVESFSYFGAGFKLLAERGVKVPERLALAGFDSIDLHQVDSSIVDVRSILVAEQDGEAMGRQAATRLKELIEKKLTSPETRLEVFLPPKRLGSKLV